MFDHSMLPTSPGAIIGYRKSGAPIRVAAGGAPETGEGEGQQQEPQAPAAEVTPPADAGPPADQEVPVNPDALRVDQLPSWAQKLYRDLRKEAGDYRSAAKDAQKAAEEAAKAQGPSAEEIAKQVQADFAAQIAKAIGMGGEEKQLAPEQIIEKLTSERDMTAKERDQEREDKRRMQIQLALHGLGSKYGADIEALTDSRAFTKKIRDLDPAADDFGTKLGEFIQLAIDDNPKFKAATLAGPPPRSGGEFAGGPGGRSTDSEPSIDDFRKQRKKPSS